MNTNDKGLYKGDLQFDTLKTTADVHAIKWAEIAEELGFAGISQEEYWDPNTGSLWRLGHFYRMFLILVASKIEMISDVEVMIEDTPANRESLSNLILELKKHGITFFAIPYDILTLLVLIHLREKAIMRLGIHLWKDEIHEALHKLIKVPLPT